MQTTKIEWVKNPDGTQGYSWNPIKGLCPGNCWYCYGKRYYERFWHLHGYPVRFYEDEIRQIFKLKKPSGIFACSVFEIFHPITNNPIEFDMMYEGEKIVTWRDAIFKTIEAHPQHRFYVLTKFPQNIDREMPDNVWLGVTITGTKGEWEAFDLGILRAKAAKIKFISIEPLLKELFWNALKALQYFDWIIIGKLTGYGHKYDPKKEWIEKIIAEAKHYNIPIFLKDNVKDIWQGDLIQEFPIGISY